MGAKRYYWIRLRRDFFDSLPLKRLRLISGGETFTLIYLKCLLLGIDTGGVITFRGVCDDLFQEIAVEIDEKVDDVKFTLGFLIRTGLAETGDDGCVFFPYGARNVGSESESAERVRRFRERQHVQALHGNAAVAPEIESDKISPYSPPKGGLRRSVEHKDAPDWKPEEFERLWRWYPTGETPRPAPRGDRQRAIRAWDKLHPDEELIGTIDAALAQQAASDQWQRGVGIPHLSTYLNSYGWEEADADR